MPHTPLPYRILIGPLYNPGVLGGYFGHPDIRTFMSEPAEPGRYDLSYEIGRDSFADLLARLDGWEPDLVIWWDLIYQALPPGIADCPYPTAVIVGDWNLHFFAVEHYVSAFDYVFGDRQLMALLAAMGHGACQYWPGFSFEPAKHHPVPGLGLDYDISFVGNLNHLVQRQRAAYLERIARLGERWRVRIAGGVHGEAYTRLLASSRIVFNHSIRGEMNMRAYEAPACGALLLMEAANLELRDFLTPGQECVVYADENLEALIEHYLSHEDQRAAIAAAGHARIQAYSYEHQFGRLIELLPQVLAAYQGPAGRGFHRLAPWQRLLVSVRQLYRANTPGAMQVALEQLAAGADFGPGAEGIEPALLNQMGKFLLELALDQGHYQQAHPDADDLAGPNLAEAEHLLTLAQALAPQEPVPAFNLAWCRELRGQSQQALADYAAALGLLAAGPAWNPWFDPVLPLGYNQRFGIEWDRRQAAGLAAGDPARRACLELLQWQIHDRRAHLLLPHDPAAAEAAWREALGLCPEFGESEALLGQALLAQGRQAEAIAAFEAAIARQPFMVGLWILTARLQIAAGDFDAAIALLAPRLPVLAVNEGLTRERPGLEDLLRQARIGQALATGSPLRAEWLAGPFSLTHYRQLCDWAQVYPVPQALTAPLTLVWQPGWPEPGCLFPPESGVAFAGAPAGLSLRIGLPTSQTPSPPCDYQRVYDRATDLAAGLIGPDQLPFLFPDLLPEAIELEDQRAFNFLLLADRLDGAACLALVRAFAAAFDADQGSSLLLWKPASAPDQAELEALEAALGASGAQVALVPEGLSPNQQGLILQSMQLILGDPGQSIAWQLAWGLRLGVPLRLIPGPELQEPVFYQGFGLAELYDHGLGSSEHLLQLRARHTELLQQAQALGEAIQIHYRERVAQQILDLCWALRLSLWQAGES